MLNFSRINLIKSYIWLLMRQSLSNTTHLVISLRLLEHVSSWVHYHISEKIIFFNKNMSYNTSLSKDCKNCRSFMHLTTSLPATSVVSWRLGLCHWCFQQILWSQEVFLLSHPKIYWIWPLHILYQRFFIRSTYM